MRGPVLFALALLVCAAPRPRAATEEPKLHGRLETRGDYRILYLWGTPRERGFAEGYLLAREIQEGFADFVLGGSFFPQASLWDRAVLPALRQRMTASTRVTARYRGLIEGMTARFPAEERVVKKLGRPLAEDDLLGVSALSDFAGFLCSSFVASGELLERGEGPLVGRNLDYQSSPKLLENTLIRIEARSDESNAWVGFGFPGLVGLVTGVSDQRMSLAVHDVPSAAPADGTFTPRLLALLELIEELKAGADPSLEARDRLRRHRFAFGMNAMLGWHHAESCAGAVLEVDPRAEYEQGVSLHPPGDLPFVVCTNHHRVRRDPAICSRFATLHGGCERILELEAEPLTFDSAWDLLGRASVDETIYRCLFDLETGAARFQRRSRPRGALLEPLDLNLYELLDRVESVKEILR